MASSTTKAFVWKNHVGEYLKINRRQTHLGTQEEISWTSNLVNAYCGMGLPFFVWRDCSYAQLIQVPVKLTCTIEEETF